MIRFTLPEPDDLVDPEYDFVSEAYSSDRLLTDRHDVYAHQLFGVGNRMQ